MICKQFRDSMGEWKNINRTPPTTSNPTLSHLYFGHNVEEVNLRNTSFLISHILFTKGVERFFCSRTVSGDIRL